MTIYPNLIRDALRTVRYPGNGKNLIENDMLYDDMRIDGMNVSFSLIFPKNPDPFSKSACKAAEAAIHREVSPLVNVTISIKTRTLKDDNTESSTNKLPYLKATHIIAVSSGKGGVGKSTIAVNIAVGLAKMGLRVGLLDTDIFGPSVPKMMQVEDERPVATEIEGKTLIEPIVKYGVKMLSIGFFIDRDQPTLWRGAMATNALKQLLSEANWGDLDYFILDTPPGTSDIHLTLINELKIDGAIIVTTPQQVALADAKKGINMYLNKKVNIPIVGLVENMAWFTPAELPENKYYIFGRDGGKQLAEILGVPLLAQIPLVQGIQECGDAGVPSVLKPASPEGIALMKLAYKITTVKLTNS